MHGTNIIYFTAIAYRYTVILQLGTMFGNITYQLFSINYIVIFAFTYKVGNNLIMNHVLR